MSAHGAGSHSSSGHGSGGGHGHAASHSSQGSKSSGSGGAILIPIIGFVIAFVLAVNGIKGWWRSTTDAQQVAKEAEIRADIAEAKLAAMTAVPAGTEALIPRGECYVPCGLNVNYRFKFRTEGHPVRIKFQGVDRWVTYSGEGDFEAPEGIRSGITQFEPGDASHPNFRLQTYERKQVR